MKKPTRSQGWPTGRLIWQAHMAGPYGQQGHRKCIPPLTGRCSGRFTPPTHNSLDNVAEQRGLPTPGQSPDPTGGSNKHWIQAQTNVTVIPAYGAKAPVPYHTRALLSLISQQPFVRIQFDPFGTRLRSVTHLTCGLQEAGASDRSVPLQGLG